jgi:phage tail-like protein
MQAELEVATEEELTSSYLQYLPAIYRTDDFIGRFLHIFEDILQPLEAMVDNIPYYFDPGMTPGTFLPWLASWLGLVLDERWPTDRHRELITSAVELYRWRGTKKGLREFLRIYTGVVPQITEPVSGPKAKLGPNTKLGLNAYLGGGEPFNFTVTIAMEDLAEVDINIVRAIIEAQKPAHTTYTLNVTTSRISDSGRGEEEGQ